MNKKKYFLAGCLLTNLFTSISLINLASPLIAEAPTVYALEKNIPTNATWSYARNSDIAIEYIDTLIRIIPELKDIGVTRDFLMTKKENTIILAGIVSTEEDDIAKNAGTFYPKHNTVVLRTDNPITKKHELEHVLGRNQLPSWLKEAITETITREVTFEMQKKYCIAVADDMIRDREVYEFEYYILKLLSNQVDATSFLRAHYLNEENQLMENLSYNLPSESIDKLFELMKHRSTIIRNVHNSELTHGEIWDVMDSEMNQLQVDGLFNELGKTIIDISLYNFADNNEKIPIEIQAYRIQKLIEFIETHCRGESDEELISYLHKSLLASVPNIEEVSRINEFLHLTPNQDNMFASRSNNLQSFNVRPVNNYEVIQESDSNKRIVRKHGEIYMDLNGYPLLNVNFTYMRGSGTRSFTR